MAVSKIHALKKLIPQIKEMDLSEGYELVKQGKEMGLTLRIVERDSEATK